MDKWGRPNGVNAHFRGIVRRRFIVSQHPLYLLHSMVYTCALYNILQYIIKYSEKYLSQKYREDKSWSRPAPFVCDLSFFRNRTNFILDSQAKTILQMVFWIKVVSRFKISNVSDTAESSPSCRTPETTSDWSSLKTWGFVWKGILRIVKVYI